MAIRKRTLRDHAPVELTKFNGLWQRGDAYNTPLDHFTDGENVKFIGTNSFGTRDGVNNFQTSGNILSNILRIYNYPTSSANTLLVLVKDGSDGKIYHVVDATTRFGPILTISGMTDFAFVAFAGRAYISPFKSFTTGGLTIQKGIENEFLYVYLGAGAAARKVGANAPVFGLFTVALNIIATSSMDAGYHFFAVLFETDTGYLTPPAAFGLTHTIEKSDISFSTIPVSVQSFVTKRHIVATRVIPNYSGTSNPGDDFFKQFQYFFIPGAVINDNVTTVLNNVSFFDVDLLSDASHLFDNLSEVDAGVSLEIYHNRLCLSTEFDNISLIRVSAIGEPEAISQVDGLLIYPLDGNPITKVQEMRDVLYAFKRNRTGAFIDNGDVPSTWSFTAIDNALGCPVHGVSVAMDSGSPSVDFLTISTFRGIFLFNGRYGDPELTWKIQNLWFNLNRSLFDELQLLNDPINQRFYIVLPDGSLLVGDYANGMDVKSIRWIVWTFGFHVSTVAIVNIDELILGGDDTITNTSGIYTLTPGATDDTLYDQGGGSTDNVKIPDPFVKTAFLGE